jgi:hypothetical protein
VLVVDDHGLGDEQDETHSEEHDNREHDHGRETSARCGGPARIAMITRIRIMAQPICVCRYAMFEA